MKNQVSEKEKKRRTSLITSIFTNISRMRNERWIDWTGMVLIDEKGKDNTLIGRNFAYKPVIVSNDHQLGDKIKVKIRRITSFDLRA
jgi:tRNA A37 methylthiotransferase MiaB